MIKRPLLTGFSVSGGCTVLTCHFAIPSDLSGITLFISRAIRFYRFLSVLAVEDLGLVIVRLPRDLGCFHSAQLRGT